MKDPLQIEKTPYERLEIAEDASILEVEAAFKKALMGKNSQFAVQARQLLKSEKERVFVDFFLYGEQLCNQIHYKLINKSQLLNNRGQTEKEWLKQQKNEFPAVGKVTHCLALLWYFTASYMENGTKGEEGNKVLEFSIPKEITLEKAWQKTIAWWAALLRSNYIRNWGGTLSYLEGKKETLNELPQKLEGFISNKFENLYLKHTEKGDTGKSKMYLSLKYQWENELETINHFKQIGRSGLNGYNQPLPGGKLLFTELGKLEEIRHLLSEGSYSQNEQQIINSILANLSPYAKIIGLIKNKEYDHALEKLEHLPAEEKKKPEVKQLYKKVFTAKGDLLLDSEKDEEIVYYLNTDKLVNRNPAVKVEVIKELSEKIYKRAIKIKELKRDIALELFTLIPGYKDADQQKKKLKANKLNNDGVKLLNEAQELVKKNQFENVLEKIGLAKLKFEEACALCPDEPVYKENKEIAIARVNQEKAFILNTEGVKLLNEVQDLIKSGNIDIVEDKINKSFKCFDQACILDPKPEVYKENKKVAQQWLDDINIKQNEQKVLLLNNEGVNLLNEVQDLIKTGDLNNVHIKVKKAYECFDNACKLDSGNKVFRKNLKLAQQWLIKINNSELPGENNTIYFVEKYGGGKLDQIRFYIKNVIEYYKKRKLWTKTKNISLFKKDDFQIGQAVFMLSQIEIRQINEKGVNLLNEVQELLKSGNYSDVIYKIKESFNCFEKACEADPKNPVFKKNKKIAQSWLKNCEIYEAIELNREGIEILNNARSVFENKHKSEYSYNNYYDEVIKARNKFSEAYKKDKRNKTYKKNRDITTKDINQLKKIAKSYVIENYNDSKVWKFVKDIPYYLLIATIWVIVFGGFYFGMDKFSYWYGKCILGICLTPYFMLYSDSFEWNFITILLVFASAIIVFWGLGQGLIGLFT